MRGHLYRMTFPNGKFYVGITSDVRRRINAHKRAAARDFDFPVSRAISKFGWDSIKFEILVIGPYDYIRKLESAAIATFNSRVPSGYNVAEGGGLAPSLAPEVRAKIAKSNTGKKQSPGQVVKHIERMREFWKNPEYRQKVITGATGIKRSEETKRKQSAARIGIKFSDEHRANLSAAHKGKPGRPWSEASKKKASESRKRMLANKVAEK